MSCSLKGLREFGGTRVEKQALGTVPHRRGMTKELFQISAVEPSHRELCECAQNGDLLAQGVELVSVGKTSRALVSVPHTWWPALRCSS